MHLPREFLSLAKGSRAGDILKFVVEKARSVGLVYPRGTGRFEERITIMTLAKEKGDYERTHGGG